MTLIEKYRKLSEDQKEKLKHVKDEVGLDNFLSEMNATLSDEEKRSALEYLQTLLVVRLFVVRKRKVIRIKKMWQV